MWKKTMDEDRRILVNEAEDEEDDFSEDILDTNQPNRGHENTCLNIVYFSSIVAAIGNHIN